MQYSAAGLELTKQSEGCVLKAYRDPTGTLTIGFGHTGPDVHEGDVWTSEHASAVLAADIAWAVAFVNKMLRVPVTQGEFDALVDFCFNEGVGHFQSSTLLRLVNSGDFDAAVLEFPKWDKSGGKVLAGLLARRQAEAKEFSS